MLFILARTEQSEKFKTKSLTEKKQAGTVCKEKKKHVQKVLKKILQVIFKLTAAYFILPP